MPDIIGPIILIALILGISYFAQNIDTMGATKKSKLEIEKINAKTRMAEIDIRKRELELKLGHLAIEHKKLEQLDHTPLKPTEAEYSILDKTDRN